MLELRGMVAWTWTGGWMVKAWGAQRDGAEHATEEEPEGGAMHWCRQQPLGDG